MIVVADASPIICLSRVDGLELLPGLFGQVVVPPAVRDEIKAGSGGTELLVASPWLQVRTVVDQSMVDVLSASLDLGEASAIALALECQADAVLIDEHAGRRLAAQRGLVVVGA